MPSETRTPSPPPSWLVDWLRDARFHDQHHSLVLDATGGIDLDQIATSVAQYLNEFDSDCDCAWRTFDSELLHTIANDPVSRDIVLGRIGPDQAPACLRPDVDRVARRLARLGGAILVGRCGADATQDLRETFHIYLCSDGPPAAHRGHMWLSPSRFSPESLVTLIANSFLDWSCQAKASPPARSPDL